MTIAAGTQGTCDVRFSAVRDAFIENFDKRGDVGASLAVMLDGRMVVDLWGGHMDAEQTIGQRSVRVPLDVQGLEQLSLEEFVALALNQAPPVHEWGRY